MATEITMPQLSDTMDQGTILTWLKQEGDPVERGDALAEVATDKADLEIECFHEGVILRIFSPVGSTVKVGEVIAVVGEAGEAVAEPASAPAASAAAAEEAPVETPAAAAAPEAASTASAPAPAEPSTGGRVKISPLAKNLAESHGVDYSQLNGSGDGGRIVKKDVESHLGTSFSSSDVEAAVSRQSPAPQAAPAAASVSAAGPQAPRPAVSTPPAQTVATSNVAVSQGESAVSPLSKMRAAIANQMVKSTTEIPHFYVSAKCEVDALMEMRGTLKGLPQYEGITFNHLIMKAVALTLRAYPRINSCFRDGSLVEPQDVNIGIVTALEDGLLIPVVKYVDLLPLTEIVSESRALVQRARAGRPKADDLSGGTFSISNIGRSEVEEFTAIINPSQGAILAVGSIQEEALVKGGSVVPGNVMRLTLSVDHRIIDGVVAGQFMTHLKQLIENPVLILA